MLLMVMASSAMLAVSLAAGASPNRKDGVLLWAMAFSAHTLAFVLFGLRGRISDMASVIVGNALLSTTFVLLAQGRRCPELSCRFESVVMKIMRPS